MNSRIHTPFYKLNRDICCCSLATLTLQQLNCAGIAVDVPPAVSNDRCLFLQVTFSVKNHDIFNDDTLHFKLARSVLKITSFLNSQTLSFLKFTRLVLNAKCE